MAESFILQETAACSSAQLLALLHNVAGSLVWTHSCCTVFEGMYDSWAALIGEGRGAFAVDSAEHQGVLSQGATLNQPRAANETRALGKAYSVLRAGVGPHLRARVSETQPISRSSTHATAQMSMLDVVCLHLHPTCTLTYAACCPPDQWAGFADMAQPPLVPGPAHSSMQCHGAEYATDNDALNAMPVSCSGCWCLECA